MPSTSAQIPKKLHQRLSSHLARAAIIERDHRPTKLSFVSTALLGLPMDPNELRRMWDDAADDLVLVHRTNPGVKRAVQLTDDAYDRLLQLNADCIDADVQLQKQHLVSLAIHNGLTSV